MKPGPSSVRYFSNKAQSTMSGSSSSKSNSSFARSLGRGSTRDLTSPKRVKFALAPALAPLVERIAAPPEFEPQRHRAELEVAPHRVEQIAAIAFGQRLGAVAEHDEGRRPRFHLSDVAQLDPLALGRGRRVGLDGLLEPAVEFAGG